MHNVNWQRSALTPRVLSRGVAALRPLRSRARYSPGAYLGAEPSQLDRGTYRVADRDATGSIGRVGAPPRLVGAVMAKLRAPAPIGTGTVSIGRL